MSVNTIEPVETTVAITPQFAVPNAQEATRRVNRWLHREIGTAVHVASATFDPITFYWHVFIELAYGATGPLGELGDVYLHAATGMFAGHPDANTISAACRSLGHRAWN